MFVCHDQRTEMAGALAHQDGKPLVPFRVLCADRIGSLTRAWRELSLQDRLWTNDYHRQPPLRQTSPSATLRQ